MILKILNFCPVRFETFFLSCILLFLYMCTFSGFMIKWSILVPIFFCYCEVIYHFLFDASRFGDSYEILKEHLNSVPNQCFLLARIKLTKTKMRKPDYYQIIKKTPKRKGCYYKLDIKWSFSRTREELTYTCIANIFLSCWNLAYWLLCIYIRTALFSCSLSAVLINY